MYSDHVHGGRRGGQGIFWILLPLCLFFFVFLPLHLGFLFPNGAAPRYPTKQAQLSSAVCPPSAASTPALDWVETSNLQLDGKGRKKRNFHVAACGAASTMIAGEQGHLSGILTDSLSEEGCPLQASSSCTTCIQRLCPLKADV